MNEGFIPYRSKIKALFSIDHRSNRMFRENVQARRTSMIEDSLIYLYLSDSFRLKILADEINILMRRTKNIVIIDFKKSLIFVML